MRRRGGEEYVIDTFRREVGAGVRNREKNKAGSFHNLLNSNTALHIISLVSFVLEIKIDQRQSFPLQQQQKETIYTLDKFQPS